MKKLLVFIIFCIPLYVWGSESFSVNLSLHETPRYAMNTSYDNRYSPLSTYRSPGVVDYLLEGVGGFVGGVAGFCGGAIVTMCGGPLILIGAPLGFLFGVSAGVVITGNMLGCKGSQWNSFWGTAVGTVAGGIIVALTRRDAPEGYDSNPFIGAIRVVGISLPIVGAVWGYHLGGHSH